MMFMFLEGYVGQRYEVFGVAILGPKKTVGLSFVRLIQA